VGCSGESKPAPATPGEGGATPEATVAPAIPTPAAAAPPAGVTVERIPIRWEPVPSPLDFVNASEPPDPWAKQREEITKRDPSTQLPSNWAVYVVEGNAEPRELTSSMRWLTNLTWDKDGLRAGFLTQRNLMTPSGPFDFSWRGHLNVDISTGRATTAFDPFPETLWTTVPGGRTIQVQTDSAGTTLLTTNGTSFPPPSQPGQTPQQPMLAAVHLISARGEARKLEGVTLVPGVSFQWVPNGKALVARDPSGVMFVPVTNGDALRVPSVRVMGIEIRYPGEGKPTEGSRVAFIVPSPTPGEAEYAVYDAASHVIRWLGRHPAPANPYVQWPSGLPGKIATRDIVIDVVTGQSEPLPPQEVLYPPHPSVNPTSPNGRYVVRLPEIKFGDYRNTEECKGLPYKIDIEDKQTNTTRTATECAGGTMASARWLGNDRLLVRVSPCAGGCDAPQSRNLLVEIATGKMTPLNDGFELNAFTSVSPDGSKVLVGGRQLRVFSSGGDQLRRQDAPEGYDVIASAWSPDGRDFAVIFGPTNFLLGP
jgi:hypothetical protein